jgi:hypothetical protein
MNLRAILPPLQRVSGSGHTVAATVHSLEYAVNLIHHKDVTALIATSL